MAPVKTLSFRCALITGSSGGLGKAMAASLISQGKKVLLAGRSESTLSSTCSSLGAAGYYVLDTGKTAAIPGILRQILSDHPDLDCLINNAGVQRPLQVLGPDYPFDLDKADEEIDINIKGPMHLTVGLMDHFKRLEGEGKGAVVMNVSSVLGLVPFSVVNPVYNGTKAWMHSWTTNLRTQLDNAGSRVKVVEIVPPQVATDLHRDRKDPNDNKGSDAMTVEDFMKDVEAGWEKDEDMIAPGMATRAVEAWKGSLGAMYDKGKK